MNLKLFKVCFVRELKAHFYSPLAYIFTIIFLILVGIFTFIVGRYFERGEASLEHSFFVWFPWLYAFLIPALCMNVWASEHRTRTLEVLLTRPVSIACFVLAKFFAATCVLLLSIVLTLPIMFTTSYLGNPDISQILVSYLGCFLLGSSYIAITLMCSSMTKSPVVSFISASAICIILVLLSLQSFGAEAQRALASNESLTQFVTSISVQQYFKSFAKGIIELRSLVYFSALCVAALFVNYFVLCDEKS